MWLLFIALLSGGAFCSELESYDYDNNLDANNDQLTSNVYILPKQIFNDGKPFYVKKDPVSGTLNFNAKTTPAEPITSDDDSGVRASSTTTTTATSTNGRIRDEKRNGSHASDIKHDISVKTTSTQNIHDYLNLPVKYSSSKFVYPLVSSSYANLKYQGNNKNYVSNHKYDSTTHKSVPVTVNNYKKYKTSYPTKSHYASSSTMPKKVSTTAAPLPPSTTMTNTFESTTKLTPVQSGRPHVSDMPPAPRPSYTTIGHKDRMNNTITHNSTPSAMRPIVVPSEIRVEKENASTASSKPTAPPKTGANKEQNSGDSMNIGDLFSYFFNNEENEATEGQEEDEIQKAITTTSQAPPITTQRPYNRYTSAEIIRNATSTTAAPATSSSSTSPPTTSSTTTTTSPRPPSRYTVKPEPIRNDQISAASILSNRNTNSGQFQDHLHPFNGHGTNFHPPASSEMTNIVVAPGSHTASFVATGQLATGNNFDRRPVADASYRPAPVNDIVTGSFAMKGQVADVYAQKQQQQVNFHVPASNMNNIVVAPDSQTATFITTSQLAMGSAAPEIADSANGESQVNEHQIKNTMNAINVYDTVKLSTQRPQGFTLATTSTPRPPSTSVVQPQQASNEPQRVRFPAEHSEAPPMLTLQQQQQQQHQNNSIKFPPTQNSGAEPSAGHVKLDTRNEIYDRNNYKQIVKHPFNMNRVVFERPQSQSNLVEQSNQMAPAQVPPFNPHLHSPPFNFKKPAFIQYPRKNLTLPNILPQFRPNTQLPAMDPTNQLRQTLFNRPQQFLYGGQNVRYKAPMHYHYGGVRTKAPLLMPNGHVPQLQVDPTHNRRHFELHQGNANQFNNRIFDRTLPQHLIHRNVERNGLATQAPVAAVIEDQQYDETSAKVAEIQVAVKPAVESKETPKVEPVTTLQQIQQQRLLHKQPSHTIVDAVAAASENSENHVTAKSDNSHLYVVYPVQDAATPNVQHNLPKTTTISQQHNFPYALAKTQRFILNSGPSDDFGEKSDNIYERPEIAAESDDATVDGDDRPIAIAYSPTESSRPQSYEPYSERIAHDNTQRLDIDASVAAINEQSFMAPFFPSVNLENTQSTHDGWSVVTPSTPVLKSRNDNVAEQSESKSNKISTSLTIQDSDETSSEMIVASSAAIESTTRKFDISNFQPELQGGFRPIYKTIEMPTVKPENSDTSIEALVYDDEEI